MGQGTTEKTDRNTSLGLDYQARNKDGSWKYQMWELVAKYRLSVSRIHELLSKAGIPKRKDIE